MKSSFVLKTAFLFSLAAIISTGLFAQETKAQKKAEKAAQIKSMIDAQNYVFVAQNAFPMSGRMRNITPDYNVAVTTDSIVSYLPFFGRAYNAPIGETRSPLDFKSKSFDYKVTPGKKDGWSITIKPKDKTSVQSMNFTVSSEGYASLQVTSTDRSAISFNGYVTAPKAKKK
ncbi:uncharacterized protein DUF4251 [Chitinophaga niastensis]|uniref:Uncharacterized protein DUF4251 n=1 Tax=Chitinophaga niastensis TaxID=536980 RepID=A0A2P8HF36_CHINA|nr:DUF4251 domain-containing protein [Chitinophaga niastensis]PSL44842.1 uncharacterized protein DUF4251 [Chitinophaga niastensis]